MPTGATPTITLPVTPPAAGSLTNKATVSSVARPDPNPANNTTTVVTTVLPLVSITATDPIASETGPDPGVFTVSRAGGTAGPLTVNYAVGGSASNGVDYAA